MDHNYLVYNHYERPVLLTESLKLAERLAHEHKGMYFQVTEQKIENLKIIIAHYFWPELDYCFKITAGFDNIYFDTSALADLEIIQESGGLKKIREILTKTVRRRSNSILFGTDWPIGSFKKHIDLINSLPLSSGEKQNIFFRNAEFAFRLKK